MRLEVQVDLSSGRPDAGELAALLQELDLPSLARRARSGPPAPDAYHYDLTVDRDDGPQELSFGDGAMPPELRPLVRLLERRAMDQLRARRGGAGGRGTPG